MRSTVLTLILVLAGLSVAHSAELSRISFTVTNDADGLRRDVARVSLPFPAGLLKGAPPGCVFVEGRRIPAQTRGITKHPDGSVRRLMVTFPVELGPGQTLTCSYDPKAETPSEDAHPRVAAPYTVAMEEDGGIRIASKADGEELLAEVKAYGPELSNPKPAKTETIETGPYFTWLRWRQDGANYSREVDARIDCLGRIRLTQRILRNLRDNDWTPDFGFEVSVPKAQPVRLPDKPVHFLQLNPRSSFAQNAELIATVKLADGKTLSLANPLALRQNRGTLEGTMAADGVANIRFSRLEPVKEENNRLMLQEGMWRVVDLLIQPGSAEQLAEAIDRPLATHADWRAYDAVYHTGPPLNVEHPVLKRLVERHVFVLQRMCIDGDDWGNMTSYTPHNDRAAINSMVRYNHCHYVWEDYFRSGDARLRNVALDWSENYRNFSVHWIPDEKLYGGSKRGRANRDLPGSPHGPGTYMKRFNYVLSYVTKGYQSFWLAYEETGDPRFKEAAEAQAKWSAKNVHAGPPTTRNSGMITDYVKLHEYTGEKLYLDQALRLWREFQETQGEDLLFTESGKPAVGNHLHIFDDKQGYQHPFVKAYIMQYATNSLPYLLKHQPGDKRLRDTIVALNDWMAKVQTEGGGWGYPGPSTGGMGWWLEYCNGLRLAYAVEPKESYLDAMQRTLRTLAALFEKHGAISGGITAWEDVARIKKEEILKMYHLTTDRDRSKDYSHGLLGFSSRPDAAVYFQVVLRDYLKHRDEASLFTRDKILDQILDLPTTLPKTWDPAASPSLRIQTTHRIVPQGLAVRLMSDLIDELAEKKLTFRWEFADGRKMDGETIERIFPAAGEHTACLIAEDKAGRYTRTISFRTPTGPGDLGLKQWPKGIRIQAEVLAGQGGMDAPVRIWHDRMGADGAAFSHWDKKGHWLEWAFDVPQQGAHFMLVKYACPADGTRAVAMDGKPIGRLRLPGSGGYTLHDQDDYAVELLRDSDGRPLPLTLTPGTHTLRLTNDDGKGCNMDYVEFLPAKGAKEL